MSRARAAQLFAVEVAEAFIQDTGAEEARAEIVDAALMIGQHLADLGIPGQWESFDPTGFVPKLPRSDPDAVIGVLLHAMAMFHWLAMCEVIDVERAVAISEGLGASAPPGSLLAGLHQAFLQAAASQRARGIAPEEH